MWTRYTKNYLFRIRKNRDLSATNESREMELEILSLKGYGATLVRLLPQLIGPHPNPAPIRSFRIGLHGKNSEVKQTSLCPCALLVFRIDSERESCTVKRRLWRKLIQVCVWRLHLLSPFSFFFCPRRPIFIGHRSDATTRFIRGTERRTEIHRKVPATPVTTDKRRRMLVAEFNSLHFGLKAART